MDTLSLHGTPLSHFTRKIRILLAELEVPFEFVRAPGVLGTAMDAYGDNPLMRVPTLVHGGVTLIESDHIARFVVATYDPSDRFGVRSESAPELNRLAVANGIMANEVVLILAKRAGHAEVDGVAYFRKLRGAIDTGLAWLDRNTEADDAPMTYADIATVCMWQHVAHYALVRDLDRYARIARRVTALSSRASIARTTPEASLAEAAAAGWSPG